MDKPKPKYKAISIDPNTIHVGATAKRNSDGSFHLNNRVYNDHTPVNSVPTRELPHRLTANILKQPHHKLPLKMLLSETARRGGYPNKASLPESSQIFKPIEDLFQRPPESEWKKSRLELLTDPRHLGKKQTQSKRVSTKFPFTNPFNSLESLYGSSLTSLEENPLPPNEDSSFFNEPICTSQKLYASNPISVTPPKKHNLETQAKNRKNDPCSTPHTMARFQNLYGSSFKRQSNNKEMSLSAETLVETPYNVADVAEPISEKHTWCREKAFATTPDNPTPNPQSPYYTNVSHDSRSLNVLRDTPTNDADNKENKPYFSHNFIETISHSRFQDLEEYCTGKTHPSRYPRALEGYARRSQMNSTTASELGCGIGNKWTMWQDDDRVHTNQAFQAGGQSRTADISIKVRETEYSFSDEQESI